MTSGFTLDTNSSLLNGSPVLWSYIPDLLPIHTPHSLQDGHKGCVCGTAVALSLAFQFGVHVNRLDSSHWMPEMRFSRVASSRDSESGLLLLRQVCVFWQKSTWKRPEQSHMDTIPEFYYSFDICICRIQYITDVKRTHTTGEAQFLFCALTASLSLHDSLSFTLRLSHPFSGVKKNHVIRFIDDCLLSSIWGVTWGWQS